MAKYQTTINWHPGERVVTRGGDVVIVAFTDPRGVVHGWRHGAPCPVPVRPVTDAFGGEHDTALCNAA